MNNKICRVLIGEHGVEFESAEVLPQDLQTLISSDSKFGVIKPRDGKTITYSILNGDTEISLKEVKKVCDDVMFSFQTEWNIDLKYTSDYANADIKMRFEDEANDPNLTTNTIAYMGYPLRGSEFYGICVINKKFVFTHDGKSRTGEEMIKMGIPVQFKDGNYGTLWLVKILMHEWGHGVLGLQHDPQAGSVMSFREDLMATYWVWRDLQRGYSKVGKSLRNNKLGTRLDRLRKFFGIGGKR